MAAVHQSVATLHQGLIPPAHPNFAIYERGLSPRQSPIPSRRTLSKPAHRHIWIVAGTSCCGKTTIATNLAKQLGAGEYIEGDDYHTAESRQKMSSGQPLTDEDRAPWLRRLRSLAVSRLQASGSKSSTNVVLTCSALKSQYRDVFRKAERDNGNIKVHFLFLIAPEGVLVKRAASRQGHYFKGNSMIKSQFAILQMPDHSEVEHDVSILDCTKPEQVVGANAFRRVQGVLAEDSI